MAVRLGIVGEDEPDARLGMAMVDAATCSALEWLDEGLLAELRSWHGVGSESPASASFLKYSTAWWRAKEQRLPLHGRFQGEIGSPDAHSTRALLLLFNAEEVPPDGVVVVRDTDGDLSRVHGFRQAVREVLSRPAAPRFVGHVVLAAPTPQREAWLLQAFAPENERERERLRAESARLGFDPTEEPERLNGPRGSVRDVKRVLAALCDHHPARESSCLDRLCEVPLNPGRDETEPAGFLASVRERIVPLFER